jgi:hypothetical protein
VFAVVAPATGFAAPDWVRASGASGKHPSPQYITGFGVSSADRSLPEEKKVGQATDIACADLVAKLRVSVVSSGLLTRVAKAADGREDIVEEFRSSAMTKTDLNIEGIEFERYLDGVAKPAYVLAYLDRSRAARHYAARTQTRIRVLREALAQNAFTPDSSNALRQVEELMLIEELLAGKNSTSDADLSVVVSVARRLSGSTSGSGSASDLQQINRFPVGMVWDNPDQVGQLTLDDLGAGSRIYHFKATGIAPYPDATDLSRAQRRVLAARAAKVMAMRELVETVGRIRIEATTAISLSASNLGMKDECTAAVKGYLQGATFGEPQYMEEEVHVTAEIDIGRPFRNTIMGTIKH